MSGAGFLLELDRGVEVAAALEIVEEVALALVQQVVIESIFLVDRNVFFQDAAADVKALGTDDNYGAGLDQIGIVHCVGFRSDIFARRWKPEPGRAAASETFFAER